MKNGQKQPWEVRPDAVWTLALPFGVPATANIGGAAYDETTNRLFISQTCVEGECMPVVHVFHASLSQTSVTFRIEHATGMILADGAYYCGKSTSCFNAGLGADMVERIDVSEQVEPGDLVQVDADRPNSFRKARIVELIIGVVATTPGFVLGNHSDARSDRRPKIALLGRVPTKVLATNGPIRPGDLLTLSKQPGYAMRCNIPCRLPIIGKALQYSVSKESVILVLVMRP